MLLAAPEPLVAQTRASNVQLANPSALEFRVEGDVDANSGFHIELIRASEAPATATPVKVWEVSTAERTADGLVRVDMVPFLTGVPDGEYLATVTVVGTPAASAPRSARSAVVGPFVLFGHGTASADSASATGTTPDGEDNGRHGMWTKVIIGIGIGLIVIPFLLR